MAKIDFTYEYPYNYYHEEKGRFTTFWSESRKTLNGCYAYPMLFHQTVPKCKKMKIWVEVEDVVGSRVLGRTWDFYVWRSNGSWTEMMTFEMPESGDVTFECDMKGYDIKGFLCVPSSNPGSSSSWSMYHSVEELVLTESLDVDSTETGKFQYGVFANRYGLKQQLNEVYVNLGGTLVQATDILINRGELESLPTVTHAHVISESECVNAVAFTPETSTSYMIQLKIISGGYHLHLYDGSFNRIDSGYFTKKSFELTAGTLYYIVAFHPYNRTDEHCEGYIQIYKEA